VYKTNIALWVIAAVNVGAALARVMGDEPKTAFVIVNFLGAAFCVCVALIPPRNITPPKG